MTAGEVYVVVPDGLAARRGQTLAEPSHVFRAALDDFLGRVTPNDLVYIAPANTFGGPVSEQRAAESYLHARGCACQVVAFDIGRGIYIDTRHNAVELRTWLESQRRWPLPPVRLIAYRLHLPRAALAFRQEGFALKDAIPVDLKIKTGEIVRRLWYYNHPWIHLAYEVVGNVLYRLRIK